MSFCVNSDLYRHLLTISLVKKSSLGIITLFAFLKNEYRIFHSHVENLKDIFSFRTSLAAQNLSPPNVFTVLC